MYLTTNSVCFTPSVEFKKLVKRHAKNIEEMVDAICILISTVKTVIESSFSCDDIYHGQKLFNNWDYLIEKIRHLLNDLDNSEKIKLV